VLSEAHVRWQPGPFDLSALYTRGTISDTQALNLTYLEQPTPVPKAFWGGYAQGAWQTEEQLSGGTLRMLALAWDAMEGAGPLLIEEPERSLDAAAVQKILPMLRAAGRRGERQLVMATHSSELLADESVTPDEVLLLEPGEAGTTARAPSYFVPTDEEQLVLFEES